MCTRDYYVKICFIQKQAFPYFGVMSLAGSLKAAGVATDAIITNLESDFIAPLTESCPDIIAISLLSTEHGWLCEVVPRIRTVFPAATILAGGIHAILYPEEILAIPGIDFVCTGEGEETLPALCHALSTGRTFNGIRGIGYRDGDAVIINERAPLLPDLNGCREDRSVYYRRYEMLRNDELKQFIASRGCPYRCTFCFNERLNSLFPVQGNRVRMKSVRQLIEEIEAARSFAPMSSLFFADDLFASDKKWLKEFGELYRQRINIPFMCLIRADRMDEETAGLLKDAGCHTVSFGVESGNEKLRTTLLNKQITDEQIIRCAAVLHRQGIRIQTSNMFCLPDETLNDALQTIRINIRIKADFVFTPLFMPFPDTRLAAYCVEKGYLPPDFDFAHLPQSFLRHSILNIPDRVQIENLQRIAYFVVRYPFLLPVAEPLLRAVTARWLYAPFLYLGTLLRYKAERGLSWRGAVTFLWRFRNSV